jgi:dethiobiotin synthetase
MRPERVAFVTATGTGVGKTWVAAGAVGHLRRLGVVAVARKPAQSYEPADASLTDAHVLARASGEQPDDVCPRHRWYPVALAPVMAAGALGEDRFTVAHLADELTWPGEASVGLVEGAGGLRSPLADDGDNLDFARLVQPDAVIVVACATLGTINAVRLTVDAASGLPGVTLVYLNRFDPGDDTHRRNRDWLADRDGYAVLTTPQALGARLASLLGSRAPSGPDTQIIRNDLSTEDCGPF